jgi:diguanylate cyclase (GGDEF)-like protein/PAS domain S-box-containing protein
VDEAATRKGVTALQLAVAGTATAWIAVELARAPDALQPVVLLLILLIAAVDLLPVPTTAGLDFTVSFPLMLASAILFPPAVAGLIALLGSFDVRELRGQMSPVRAWFNRSQMALAVMLAGTWFHAVATPRSQLWLQVPAVVVGAAIAYSVNTGMVAMMVAVASRKTWLAVLRRMHGQAPWEFVASYLGLGLLSLVISHFAQQGGVWSVVILVGFVVTARQLYFRGRALADRLAEQNATLTAQAGQLERLLEEVRGNEERFRAPVQNASDVILVVGPDLTVTYQTPSVERVLGYAPGDLLGTRLVDLVHPDDHEPALEFIVGATTTRGISTPVEWRLRHRDGTWLYVEAIGNNLLDVPRVAGVVFTIRSIMERRQLHEQLRRLAFSDSLTGLANRALFRDRVEHALSRRQTGENSVAVLFLDLDDFKVINDSLGHKAGDHLLIAVAQRLQACLRPADTAARLGGDEFAVLLEDTVGERGAVEVAERILDLLRLPILLDAVDQAQGDRVLDRELFAHASIGIAVSSPAIESEELLRNADLAMYAAKTKGKGHYELYKPSLHAATMEQLKIKADLQQAIEHGQFNLEYQPIITLEGDRVVGFEALLRWHHPERGLVHPGGFVGLAEETGLIVPIGHWVLRRACEQARSWQEAFPDHPLSISVNLSARQFQQPDLIELIREVLAETGLDPGRLVLELTESLLMQDTEATIAKLEGLKHLGVHLAIDDFGTGYSSLSYLRRFPVDILKIDRSFVEGLGTGAEESALARAIVKLGHTLRLKTVAEGIEASAQLEALRALECNFGQGFYLAHPLDPASATDLLESERLRRQELRYPRS